MHKAMTYLSNLPTNTALAVWKVIGEAPTTQIRILMTLILAAGTAIKYWTVTEWEPSLEWLGFLATMAGIDTIQHIGKRATDIDYAKAKNGSRTTT